MTAPPPVRIAIAIAGGVGLGLVAPSLPVLGQASAEATCRQILDSVESTLDALDLQFELLPVGAPSQVVAARSRVVSQVSAVCEGLAGLGSAPFQLPPLPSVDLPPALLPFPPVVPPVLPPDPVPFPFDFPILPELPELPEVPTVPSLAPPPEVADAVEETIADAGEWVAPALEDAAEQVAAAAAQQTAPESVPVEPQPAAATPDVAQPAGAGQPNETRIIASWFDEPQTKILSITPAALPS